MSNLNGYWEHHAKKFTAYVNNVRINPDNSYTFFNESKKLITIDQYEERIEFCYMFENWRYNEDVKTDSLDGVDIFGYAEWMYKNLKTAIPAAIENFNG